MGVNFPQPRLTTTSKNILFYIKQFCCGLTLSDKLLSVSCLSQLCHSHRLVLEVDNDDADENVVDGVASTCAKEKPKKNQKWCLLHLKEGKREERAFLSSKWK